MGAGGKARSIRWTPISLALLALIIIAIALGPSLTPFDAYNTYWDGYSEAASICLRPVYALPNNLVNVSSVFIVPEGNVSGSLVTELLDYVINGGRLVILNGNESFSNQLLKELGVGSRFTGNVIEDPVLNVINEKFPLAFIVSNPVVQTNATTIALDDATTISINDAGAVTIAVTSRFSAAGNSTGPFSVVVAVPVGKGYVILVSSPGMFMNSMTNETGNAEFLRALCGNGTALYLESALAGNPQGVVRAWLLTAYTYASTYPINYLIIVMPVIIIMVVLLINEARHGAEV
ncbi:DUF4350 domain-containing protein [Vulcanisaeta souniana]|uniref:DUF4350 domain-containing protein n=1 Tax=Vulcanisaeta souniana JCM 11219 TaxID=1293586 RepID=A0A830EHT2_9CREN|nr:DUF4350 domain-containing protein [Vulcanisaeta souniana]BDR92728.1 hypothetical protein Vsou_18210 [Vulcanisaeta souniana JCM 11219]GGI84168.1 hypothetical protein GCM10007112_21300 [Vulcanisaeta souniana JCM 11219]